MFALFFHYTEHLEISGKGPIKVGKFLLHLFPSTYAN